MYFSSLPHGAIIGLPTICPHPFLTADRSPSFFSPFYVDKLQRWIQDGAFWENNPLDITVCEAHLSSPPSLPAFVISLGTGSGPGRPSGMRLWGRIVDYLDRTLDSRSTWEKFALAHPQLQDQGRLKRFDLDAVHSCRIDDVSAMTDLSQKVRSRYDGDPEIEACVLMMLVNMFYFQLDQDPEDVFDGTLSARLLCRWKVTHDGFGEWWSYIRSLQPRVIVNGRYHGTVQLDRYGNIYRSLDIPFVHHVSTLRIQMQLADFPVFDLGGSPFSVMELREWQGYHSPFGSPQSMRRQRPPE